MREVLKKISYFAAPAAFMLLLFPAVFHSCHSEDDGKDGTTDAMEDHPDVSPDAHPDVQPDANPDVPLDAHPDVQPDAHPDVQPDAHPDVQPDAHPDVQPDADPDVHPDADPDLHPDVSPDVPTDAVDEYEAPTSATLTPSCQPEGLFLCGNGGIGYACPSEFAAPKAGNWDPVLSTSTEWTPTRSFHDAVTPAAMDGLGYFEEGGSSVSAISSLCQLTGRMVQYVGDTGICWGRAAMTGQDLCTCGAAWIDCEREWNSTTLSGTSHDTAYRRNSDFFSIVYLPGTDIFAAGDPTNLEIRFFNSTGLTDAGTLATAYPVLRMASANWLLFYTTNEGQWGGSSLNSEAVLASGTTFGEISVLNAPHGDFRGADVTHDSTHDMYYFAVGTGSDGLGVGALDGTTFAQCFILVPTGGPVHDVAFSAAGDSLFYLNGANIEWRANLASFWCTP